MLTFVCEQAAALEADNVDILGLGRIDTKGCALVGVDYAAAECAPRQDAVHLAYNAA